jgi:hypothetical protein
MDDAGKTLWIEDNPNDIEPLTEARFPIHDGATMLQGTEPDLRAISGAMLASSREETLGE